MPDLTPLRLLVVTFAGWIYRHQAQAIDYLVEENRVLKEQLRGRRLRLTDDQRRRLAAKGKALGRRRPSYPCATPRLDYGCHAALRWDTTGLHELSL